MNISFWVFVALNILLPSYPFWATYIQDQYTKKHVQNTFLGLILGLQIISCGFLTFALIKIRSLLVKKVGVKINLKQMILHLTSYYLYLVTFIIDYCEILKKDPNSKQTYIANMAKIVASTVSQLILILVFHYLCSFAIKISQNANV